nr:MAG TPA: hypothetical protein [Bacteriophage sp.]
MSSTNRRIERTDFLLYDNNLLILFKNYMEMFLSATKHKSQQPYGNTTLQLF